MACLMKLIKWKNGPRQTDFVWKKMQVQHVAPTFPFTNFRPECHSNLEKEKRCEKKCEKKKEVQAWNIRRSLRNYLQA